MKFTKAYIERLAPPAGKSDHFEWDDATPGFGIRFRGGRRKWTAQLRIGGRTRRISIGDVGRIERKDMVVANGRLRLRRTCDEPSWT